MTAPGRQHVEARAQRARDGHRRGPSARGAEQPDPVLRADQRRSQHVVDAAVEDRDRRPVDGLACRRPGRGRRPPGRRGSGRAPARAAPRPGTDRSPSRGRCRPAHDRTRRGRATPRAARTGCPARPRHRRSGPVVWLSRASSRAAWAGRGDVGDERARLEHVRRAERVQPEQVEMRGTRGQPRGVDQVARVHPELAGAVVADEADAFEPGDLRHRRAEQHRLAPAGRARDALEPSELAERFDGDGADPGGDRRLELPVALARTGHDDSVRIGSRRGSPSPAHPRTRRRRRGRGCRGGPRRRARGSP